MLKSVWRISGIMGLLAAALSLSLIVQHALSLGLSPVFQLILDYYSWFRSAVLSPVAPLANSLALWIAEKIGLDLALSDRWGDVFVLLSLYFTSRARAYWQSGSRSHATLRFALGLPIAFLTAVFAGLFPDDRSFMALAIFLIIALGLVLFDFIDATWAAIFYRRPSVSLMQEIYRYLSFSLPTIAVVVTSLACGLFFFYLGLLPDGAKPGAASMLILVVGLTGYWGWRGWVISGMINERMHGESRWSRFKRSSTTRLSFLMLTSILGATVFFALNAGHSLFLP